MADPIQNTIAPTSADAAATAAAAKEHDRARVKELAHQFESMLMTQMLRSMRQSMLSDDETDSLGKSTMTDTFDTELGQSLSQAGGLGLSDVLVRAFDQQAAGHAQASTASAISGLASTSASPATPAAASIPASIVAPGTTLPVTGSTGSTDAALPADPAATSTPVLPEGRVTSAFGWRNDPFNGKVKFHSGTDVKMAYGQDVKSAAAGRISFVGDQSGYGLTVMVDHGNGVVSRYAHLSSASVQVGDMVESGQMIARSGNSGRSTGAHLHFEVLDNGRAVDPETMGQHLH